MPRVEMGLGDDGGSDQSSGVYGSGDRSPPCSCSRSATGSAGSSMRRVGPGTRYSSAAHVPRSVSWQRSEQNGRQGLPFQSVGRRQSGQNMPESYHTVGNEEVNSGG